MRNYSIGLVLVGLSLTLGACQNKPKPSMEQAPTYSSSETQQFYGKAMTAAEEAKSYQQTTYYFDYDSYELSEADRLSLYAHAKYLIQHPKAHIRLEGHTDERGSREYNVALAERRAKSLANVMTLKGVTPHQITVVSFGKERPQIGARGHDEASWAQNRRAEIVYED